MLRVRVSFELLRKVESQTTAILSGELLVSCLMNLFDVCLSGLILMEIYRSDINQTLLSSDSSINTKHTLTQLFPKVSTPPAASS